jgi:hypothetical protein
MRQTRPLLREEDRTVTVKRPKFGYQPQMELDTKTTLLMASRAVTLTLTLTLT